MNKSASAAKRSRKAVRKHVRKLILVRWGDAWVHGAWDDETPSTKKAKPVIVHTVGWLIKQDKTGVLVAAQIADGAQLANQSFIPKGMIKDITVLSRGNLVRE
jgi:hypothetical protein